MIPANAGPIDGLRFDGLEESSCLLLSATRGAVEQQLAKLLEMTVAERKVMPGLPKQRADVIAAGVAIFTRLLHRLETDKFIVNDRGVRWGLAYEQLAHSG